MTGSLVFAMGNDPVVDDFDPTTAKLFGLLQVSEHEFERVDNGGADKIVAIVAGMTLHHIMRFVKRGDVTERFGPHMIGCIKFCPSAETMEAMSDDPTIGSISSDDLITTNLREWCDGAGGADGADRPALTTVFADINEVKKPEVWGAEAAEFFGRKSGGLLGMLPPGEDEYSETEDDSESDTEPQINTDDAVDQHAPDVTLQTAGVKSSYTGHSVSTYCPVRVIEQSQRYASERQTAKERLEGRKEIARVEDVPEREDEYVSDMSQGAKEDYMETMLRVVAEVEESFLEGP